MPVGTPPISSTRKAAQGENSEAADTPPIVSAGKTGVQDLLVLVA
jgi:hypothetical protein